MHTAPLLAGTLMERQIDSEGAAIRAGVERYRELVRDSIERGQGASLKPAERMLAHWFAPLVESIRGEQKAIEAGEAGVGRAIYGPLMLAADPEKAAVIAMHVATSWCMAEPAGTRFSRVCYEIGNDVLAELNLIEGKREKRKELDDLIWRVKRLSPRKVRWWAKRHLDDPLVCPRAATALGSALAAMLVATASAAGYDEEFSPAFKHARAVVQSRGYRTVGQLIMTERCQEVIERGHELRQLLRPKYQPMLVPPYPWGEQPGGYVSIRVPAIAQPTPEQKEALAAAPMERVYAALSAIDATPWSVDAAVLACELAEFNRGGGACGLPPKDARPLPPRPERFADEAESKAWRKAASAAHRQNVRDRGERRQYLRAVVQAEIFAREPRMYFPHTFDFRGRAYPKPALLHHQTNDPRRALLRFAEARPVTQAGRRWLAIHAANCYGVDKVSFAAREEWTRSHRLAIADAAECSDRGELSEWAARADKPWQFVAACRALADETAAARLPVQLDGTCNGLQWYAALGRDEQAAPRVNMVPAERPESLYLDVTDIVRLRVEADIAAGGEAGALAARVLPLVCKDVLKSVIMTKYYGVTLVGARQQIRDRLHAAGLHRRDMGGADKYLTATVLSAIVGAAPRAGAIMEYLRGLATAVVRETGRPLAWATPLGFPVVQSYRCFKKMRVRTLLQDVYIRACSADAPVRPRKQINAFAPNFIHSLDATHMLRTALRCRDAGIAFAAVHDSYWTHAEDAELLGRILREEFVAMNEEPLLEDLVRQLRERYPGVRLPAPPDQGSFDIRQVLAAPYFFS